MTLKETWANRTYRPFVRQWPKPARKGTAWLMPLELMGLIPILVIFGIAQPDLYRTDLWKIGYENKLNSNPNMILYAYANHKPLPQVPLVWSRTLTDFNVAISVISLFLLLVKLITFIMKGWLPLIALVINIALTALYTVSVYGQIGPDYADPRYPAPAAWYFRYGCDMAKEWGVYKSCQIAQSSLGITFYMLMIYLLNLGFAAWAMWPNKELNDGNDDDDNDSLYGHDAKPVEMQNMKNEPLVSATPFTPRTQAFHTLNRQLPLRAQRAP